MMSMNLTTASGAPVVSVHINFDKNYAFVEVRLHVIQAMFVQDVLCYDLFLIQMLILMAILVCLYLVPHSRGSHGCNGI